MSRFGLLLVRHGETESNVAGKLQGASDSPLTARGTEQAAALGRWLRDRRASFRAAWSSPTGRARRTADLLLAELGVDLVVDERPELVEVAVGRLEGLTPDERDAVHPRFGDRPRHDRGDYTAWGGEGRGAVEARAARFFEVASERLGPGEAGLVVSHGGWINAAVRRACAHPPPTALALAVPNTAALWLDCHRDGTGTLRWVGGPVFDADPWHLGPWGNLR